jgi:hypothetical protein
MRNSNGSLNSYNEWVELTLVGGLTQEDEGRVSNESVWFTL